MRKEYHKLFKGKFYWEYDPDVPKNFQELVSVKYNDYKFYCSKEFNRIFPIKIISQFKRDVDRFFAKLEFEKMSEQLANPWTHSVTGIRFATRNPMTFKIPNQSQIKQPEEKPMTLKLEVYEAANKEEDKVLRLKLKKDNSGDVILCAVDDKGNLIEGGSIVYISKNGKLVKCANVSDSLGLTTKQGQIVISGEFE